MLIGVDFDNTIADYDQVFAAQARRQGLLDDGFAGGKVQVREALRARADGERSWMALQGCVYGAHMLKAAVIDGVKDFFAGCRAGGIGMVIVSHKTQYGHFDPDRIDLREAARAWLRAQGFFGQTDHALPEDRVFFEPTRADKVARIRALGCTHFIDDLEEVFLEPGFPPETSRLLFIDQRSDTPRGPFQVFRSWPDISAHVFG